MDLNDRHSQLFGCRVICVFALKKKKLASYAKLRSSAQFSDGEWQ